MKRVKIRKSNGRFAFFGHIEQTEFAAAEYETLPAEVQAPDPEAFVEPVWDRTDKKWVEGNPAVVAKRKNIADLRKKFEDGTMTNTDRDEAIKHLLGGA